MQNEERPRRLVQEELTWSAVPKPYDTKSIAKIFGICLGTLKNWQKTGRSSRVTFVGGIVRYQLAEINAWLQVNTEGRA